MFLHILLSLSAVNSLRVPEINQKHTDVFKALNFLDVPQHAVRPRVLFSAGLEGAGHHFVESVLKLVPHSEVRFPPQWRCDPMGTIWSEDGIPLMQDIFRELNASTLWVLNGWSYPCGGQRNVEGRRQHLPFHPHVDWMYQAAAGANVDLHVLLIHRPLDDALAADCLHRDFMSCAEQAAYMTVEGGVMVEQLRNIPRGITTCFQYGQLDVMENALSEHVDSEQAAQLVKTLWRDHVDAGRRESVSEWSTYVQSLSELQSDLDELCKSATG